MDTVLYNNTEGNGGIYAILRDYTGTLTATDFVNEDRDAISGFTVHEINDLTAVHAETSQQDLDAILRLATRISDFDRTGNHLSFAAGVTEIWYRQIDDADAAGGRSTLITAFNGTTEQAVHYAVLTGWTRSPASASCGSDILIRPSRVGRDDNDGPGNLNDHLYGSRNAEHRDGGDGDDLVEGLSGDDRLYGGSGNDWLSGGGGRDILTGGADDDVFDVSDTAAALDRADLVTDFTRGEDKIGIRGDFIAGRYVHRKEIWIKSEDADKDGDLDTVLYNNAEGNGGIYAILRDYTGTLTADDFGDSNGNAIDGFTVHEIV